MAAAPGQWGNLSVNLQTVAQDCLQIANNPPLTVQHLNQITLQLQQLNNQVQAVAGSQQQLNNQVQAVAGQQQQLNNQVQAVANQLANLDDRLQLSEQRTVARTYNSFALLNTVLEVVPILGAAVPPNWPANATAKDISRLTSAQINPILTAYNLGLGQTVAVRRDRLLKFVGYRLGN